MASIRTKELASGKRSYQVRWYSPDGREQSRQFARHTEAKKFKTEIESSLSRGLYIDPSAGKVTFREFGDKWLANQSHLRASSLRTMASTLRTQIYPLIGDANLNALRRSDIQHVLTQCTERYAPSVRRVLATLLNSAVLDDLLPRTPMRSVGLRSTPRQELIIPTVEQVRSIASAMGKYEPLVMLAASTGLRRSELLAVRLETIDRIERTVRVRPDTGQVVTGGGVRLGPPKTHAAARTVPLGSVALKAIADRTEAHEPDPDDGYGGLLYSGRAGPVHPATLTQQLGPVMAKHGFPPRTGLHIFRHFYASALIHAGESVKVVQKRLGHTSAVETLDTYGHLWPESDEASRKAIDAAFA